MQSVLIKDNKVLMILEWEDGRKANIEDYPDYEVVFLDDDNKLDENKMYNYVDGSFIEVELDLTNVEPSPEKLLTQQVASLAIENKRKDVAIESLVKMVADLNIKIQGGNV